MSHTTLGLGVITWQAHDMLCKLLHQLACHTIEPCLLFVADDGSTDETPAMLARTGAGQTYPHRGVCHQRNRVLRHLFGAGCTTVICLDDDAEITEAGWERHWIAAVAQWGLVWYDGSRSGGEPVACDGGCGHVMAISRGAWEILGDFDERYDAGWGFEDMEYARRWRRCGFRAAAMSQGVAGGGSGRHNYLDTSGINRKIFYST